MPDNNLLELAEQPFLEGLPVEHLKLLVKGAKSVKFKVGDRILTEGGPANLFYLLLEGSVELEASVLKGQPVPIQTLGAGDLLGWSWLFPPFCWHFDARAATPVKAAKFPAKQVRELCEQNHDLGYALMKRVSVALIQRLQSARCDAVVRQGGGGPAVTARQAPKARARKSGNR
jgi:CRP-like cAMP-binding protein